MNSDQQALQGALHFSGNLPPNAQLDPALAAIVEAWPTLPEASRRRIMRLVNQAGNQGVQS